MGDRFGLEVAVDSRMSAEYSHGVLIVLETVRSLPGPSSFANT